VRQSEQRDRRRDGRERHATRSIRHLPRNRLDIPSLALQMRNRQHTFLGRRDVRHTRALENAAKQQLQALADRRKARSARSPAEIEEDREDLALLEEMEEFALEEMAKMLALFDANHPLLVAVPNVRDLGLGLGAWDSDGDGGEE
jgi:hypothetical protein